MTDFLTPRLTMRQYYAGLAMQATLASPVMGNIAAVAANLGSSPEERKNIIHKLVAETAFQIADAMEEAEQKGRVINES